MKLAELIQTHDLSIKVETALKAVDWNYDVDGTNDSRFTRGAKAIKEAEELVAAFYRVEPESATELWQKHCPYAMAGSLPWRTLHK
jgi:hypothetical protein